MSEIKKSLFFGGVALALAILALLTAPRSATPDAFLDRGEPFFPDFDNPNEAATLEVIEFDEETAEAIPFKVTSEDGRWTIPSHHDYPADGQDRLARTAAGVIGITKDDFRTDNVADHEACGVLDPLDDAVTSLRGRGKRVTIRGENDQILADFIVGKTPEERSDLRFVRVPGQKRVYVARMDLDISSKFEDWIESDLLQVDQYRIDQVILKDYSIDERTGRVHDRDVVILDEEDGTWSADGMSPSQEIDSTKMDDLLSAVDGLSIVGVRPKPEGLSRSLKGTERGLAISQGDLLSLQARGYYFSQDGSLLSNEGELEVSTMDGVIYVLRFGEILYGRGEAVTAGTEESDSAATGPGENRYLFITAAFDPDLLPEPDRPGNTDFQSKPEEEWTAADRSNRELHDKHEEWSKQAETGREAAAKLNARFADWYYVISDDSFQKIHLTRGDLVKTEES